MLWQRGKGLRWRGRTSLRGGWQGGGARPLEHCQNKRQAERVCGTTVNSWGVLYAHKYEGMNIVSPLSQTEEKVFKHTLTTTAITK